MSQAGCTFREQPSQAYTCGCLAFEPDPASERLCTDCKHPRNFHPSAISTTTTPDPPPINPTASSVPQSQALTTVLAALRAGGAAEPSSSATAYQAPTARSQSSSGARVSHSDAVVEANAGFRGGKGQGKGKGKGRASAKETKAARATKAVSETGGGATLCVFQSKSQIGCCRYRCLDSIWTGFQKNRRHLCWRVCVRGRASATLAVHCEGEESGW
ncbi:hypothetical protein FA95DRAFT_1224020 [Auriscalpium vulgare]|uniref:Uncharacterized protein n=1 Tax=Auriscalpium vulgare TaxID=40419 RepID=A0ACB8R3D1_9AGAM|nr:hypothetical protein FA95DRAFT_1224020 [Auriscalpium vulgare]